MTHRFTTSYLEDSLFLLGYYKHLAEGAMAQVSDKELFQVLDSEMNSIAIVVKHIAGNMRSRWMDFLTTDGEKPDRHRDSEFVEPPPTRAALMESWEAGWRLVFSAIEPLEEADLGRTVIIGGQPYSVMQAIQRQIAHYASHIGQIILLAKHFRGADWKSLTIPKRRSVKGEL